MLELFYFSCHDLSSWDLWEDLFHIVRLSSENVELDDEVGGIEIWENGQKNKKSIMSKSLQIILMVGQSVGEKFLSQTPSTVFKPSKLNLLHMITLLPYFL